MPAAAGEPADVLADTGGNPLVVSLDSSHALDPVVVGDQAAWLANARLLGLPVADGVAVTAAGIAADDPLVALRHAWCRVRGRVRIMLTGCGMSGGSSPSVTCDATTWMGLLNGVYDVLAHDRLENPSRCNGGWGVLILPLGSFAGSVLVETGPSGPPALWTSPDRSVVTESDRERVCLLAVLARTLLGRPMSMEMMTTGGGEWTIVDMRFHVDTPPAGAFS